MRRVARAQVVVVSAKITTAARRWVRQTEHPRKRRLDNYKAVVWAIAAKEPGLPKADQWEAGGEEVAGVSVAQCPQCAGGRHSRYHAIIAV
jgi:hypothetical protein